MHAFRSNKKLKSAESYVLSAEESYHSPAVFFIMMANRYITTESEEHKYEIGDINSSTGRYVVR